MQQPGDLGREDIAKAMGTDHDIEHEPSIADGEEPLQTGLAGQSALELIG